MPDSISYPGVYVEDVSSGIRAIAGVETSIAAFVDVFACGPLNTAVEVQSFAEFEQGFGGISASSEASYAIRQFFLNGGTRAFVVRIDGSAGLAKAIVGDETAGTGLYALKDAFNILCIPATMTMKDGDAAAVCAAAEAFCGKRHAMLILDPPAETAPDTVAGITQWLAANAALSSPDAALYFPRLVIDDPLGPRTIATSGTLAGVWARNDAARGVWQAPAGDFAVLNGVNGLACKLTDAEGESLNARGINGLRDFFGARPVVWGARTMAGADGSGSTWKYVSIRRLAVYLEHSLCEGARWAVFEPDGDKLRTALTQAVQAFMQSMFQKGAFRGTTPKDAYYVNGAAITQSQLDAGSVNIEVGFAPLKPAEFVVLQIALMMH